MGMQCFNKRDGGCCCKCKHSVPLMKHPSNGWYGHGSIIEPMGRVCNGLQTEGDRVGIFMDTDHGMCEMFEPLNK